MALRKAIAYPAIATQAGSADPRKIPGLVGWWDARYLDVADGSPVQNWDDLSGNGNHLSQYTTSAQPTFFANYNGAPALKFDGVDDRLDATNPDAGRYAPLTCVAKVERDPATTTHGVIAKYALSASPWRNWRYYVRDTGGYSGVFMPSSGIWTPTALYTWPGGEKVTAFRVSDTLSFDVSIDGVIVGTNSVPDEYGGVGNFRVSHMTAPWYGWMRWVALYDRALSDEELRYLNDV